MIFYSRTWRPARKSIPAIVSTAVDRLVLVVPCYLSIPNLMNIKSYSITGELAPTNQSTTSIGCECAKQDHRGVENAVWFRKDDITYQHS